MNQRSIQPSEVVRKTALGHDLEGCVDISGVARVSYDNLSIAVAVLAVVSYDVYYILTRGGGGRGGIC